MSAFVINDVAKLYQIIEFCKFCHGKKQNRMPFLWECYIWCVMESVELVMRISEGHYLELMRKIGYGESEDNS